MVLAMWPWVLSIEPPMDRSARSTPAEAARLTMRRHLERMVWNLWAAKKGGVLLLNFNSVVKMLRDTGIGTKIVRQGGNRHGARRHGGRAPVNNTAWELGPRAGARQGGHTARGTEARWCRGEGRAHVLREALEGKVVVVVLAGLAIEAESDGVTALWRAVEVPVLLQRVVQRRLFVPGDVVVAVVWWWWWWWWWQWRWWWWQWQWRWLLCSGGGGV